MAFNIITFKFTKNSKKKNLFYHFLFTITAFLCEIEKKSKKIRHPGHNKGCYDYLD